MRFTPAMAGLAVLVTAIVGCGDDDDKSDKSSTTTTADSDDEDVALAEGIVLTIDDMPSGWEATPAEESEGNEDVEADLAQCFGVDPAEMEGDHPKATSPDFASANNEEVSAKATIMPSVDEVTRRLDVLKDDKAPGCFTQVFAAELDKTMPSDVQLGEVTVAELAIPPLGDDSVAYRVTIPFTTEGVNVEMYLDFVAARVGRVAITGEFSSLQTPFDTDEAARLMNVMVARAPLP